MSAHDEMKWLGLDDDGKHHEWDNWLRSALEEYVQGYHNSLDRGSRGAPCIEYVKLEGERIPTPMFDKLCFQKVILLCIGMSMLAGEHAEKALGIRQAYRGRRSPRRRAGGQRLCGAQASQGLRAGH